MNTSVHTRGSTCWNSETLKPQDDSPLQHGLSFYCISRARGLHLRLAPGSSSLYLPLQKEPRFSGQERHSEVIWAIPSMSHLPGGAPPTKLPGCPDTQRKAVPQRPLLAELGMTEKQVQSELEELQDLPDSSGTMQIPLEGTSVFPESSSVPATCLPFAYIFPTNSHNPLRGGKTVPVIHQTLPGATRSLSSCEAWRT